MKRQILMAAGLALLLSACSRPDGAMTTQQSAPTAPAYYDATHPVEQQTQGAVRGYSLQDMEAAELLPMGDKLLVVTKTNRLIALQGDNCQQAAEAEAEIRENTQVAVSPLGAGYVEKSTGDVVILNPLLQEAARIPIPEDAEGLPVISLKNHEVYYAQGQELRAIDLSSGISRLLRTKLDTKQRLLGSWFEGDVLILEESEEAGETVRVYVESGTGKTVGGDDGVYEMTSQGDAFFASQKDGKVDRKIFGRQDGTSGSFLPEETVYPVLSLYGAVTAVSEGEGLRLAYYDLESGRHTASVTLEGADPDIKVSGHGGFLWILAKDTRSGAQSVYRWEIAKSQVQDETIYTGPVYTAENPDREGLTEAQKRAEELGSRFGVKISLAEEAKTQAGETVLRQEYQVPTITAMLEELEPVLERFPEGFLKGSIRGGSVRIGLVRQLEGDKTFAQLYKDGNAWILLTPESNISDDFIRGLGYVVDSFVIGNSRDYDTWKKLNPSGFQYDHDLEKNARRQDLSLTEGEGRAFVDRLSMNDPREDRAAIFFMALSDEGKDVFQAPILQKKLLRMCEGIRESYGLEKKSETYPWEQYLEKSLAYGKK